MKNYRNPKSKLNLKKTSIAKLNKGAQSKIVGGSVNPEGSVSGLGTETDWTMGTTTN
ncbi:class I lanthipeptide [uncultured Aquimarina sp.]|uniref:class I lanthipeptide n=1 Tax=uncultured Aquimarina sp. TaxID=575652 RepID=UPI002635BADA|nr:class I lanthipeptide [uncultured Aquimarina sp.]